MKYKVGDKVRVRKDIFLGRSYGNWAFIHDMAQLIGKYVTVKKVLEDSYEIEEDISRITDEMLEDVEEEFKLPEKWCIKQCSGLMDWGKTTLNRPNKEFDSDKSYYWPVDESLVNWDFGGKRGREEITFNQFKKYVLKESESTPVKEEVKFEVGRWYKLKYAGNKFSYLKFLRTEKLDSYNRVWYSDLIWDYKYRSDSYIANAEAEESAVLLTDLFEIQQYLPESHPDKIKKRSKKVEDLKYPDVVHCSSKEQHDKINLIAGLTVYEGDKWYLTGAHGRDSKPYDESGGKGYVNYEFSDIIFPEENVVDKWFPGSYVVSLKKNSISITGFNEGSIATVVGDNTIRLLSRPDETWACGQRDEEINSVKWFPILEEAQAFSDELLGKNKVETKPMLSKEELLAEAKRRYPMGTRFNAARGNRGEYTVKKDSVFRYNDDDAVCIEDDGNGTIYFKGEWGKITYKPTVEKQTERLSFYVKYNTSFTEDLYIKLLEWCTKNNSKEIRGWSDSYKGLIECGYFVYDNLGLNNGGSMGYGVDNNRQGCINGYSVQQVKELIGYKEAFDKQGKSVVQNKEELVQTGMSQRQACDSCKYIDNCGIKGFSCNASGGQHYPKDDSSERYTVAADQFDAESSSDWIGIGKLPLDRGMGLYEQMEKMHMIEMASKLPPLGWVYNPYNQTDCKLEAIDSDEIYVPIIKTEVKQIKL